jgi:hypothetical protein
MPSKSKKQNNFMAAIAHSPEFAKKAGVPMSVGKDFVAADKGKTFRADKAGSSLKQGINKQQTNRGKKQLPNAMLNKYIGHNNGGMMKSVDTDKNPGLAKLPTEVRNKMGYAKNGGMMKHSDMAKDKPMMKKIADVEAKKVVKGHEKRMHKMASGGKASQLNKANGIATKGKSKGTMIKMNKGGAC